MEQILDLDKDLNIDIFDEVVMNANCPDNRKKEEAERVLLKFKELPNSWTKVDYILNNSKLQESHYVALQLLESMIKVKWSLFDEGMKQGLRMYVFQLVIEKSKGRDKGNYVLQELNTILIEIAKKDWPRRWPSFITDLISVSQGISMEVCRNSLNILKRLNEEVFIFSEDSITTVRKRLLRNQLKVEFPQIFGFIKTILEYSRNTEMDESLLEATLESFQCFCGSMPLDFIFLTEIIDLVLEHLNSMHSVACLSCLIEIVDLGRNRSLSRSHEIENAEKEKILVIHRQCVEFLKMYFNKFQEERIYEVYGGMDKSEKVFILKLAQLLSSLYEVYISLLEARDITNTKVGLGYLIQISKINNSNIFSVAFEMWNKFVFDLYSEFPFASQDSTKRLRRSNYIGILNQLMGTLVDKMPRPEEVFIVVDEYNEVIRKKMTDTDQIEFYRKMRGCLYHLAFLIEEDMKKYFISKVGLQLDDKEWDCNYLNRLCWAIGSISGAFSEVNEREFFVNILKHLLALCEMKSFKTDKAVIASNIMFIIGQYHRFLLHNKSFLKTVVKKLFEFMDEDHEGIKDMACDNFFKIVEKCPVEFLTQRENDEIFIVYILKNLPGITATLEFYQKRIVYEALLLVIKEVPKTRDYKSRVLGYADLLLSSLLNFNILADEHINRLPNMISNVEEAKMISHVLKSHSLTYRLLPETCPSSCIQIFPKFFRIFDICNSIILEGKEGTAFNNAKAVKAEIIELFTTVIDSKFVQDDFVNMVCEKVIFDYKNNSIYKEPAILALGSSIVRNVENDGSVIYLQREAFMISALIEPSIPFLMQADENLEISKNYLLLIESMLLFSFNSFFSSLFGQPSFRQVYNTLLYSLICIRDVSDLSLNCLTIIFKKCYEQKIFQFYTQNYMSTLENILGIIFDRDMRYNFDQQCLLLAFMIRISKDIPSLDGINPNFNVLSEYIVGLFMKSFPNITQESVKVFSVGLFELCGDDEVFKEHVDDFRVKVYEFGTDEDLQEEIDLKNERIRRCKN
ncbi:putative exportin 1 [Encephalitozoon hellem ATCC 50504]|uniref:Exportin 1 n=1 Tax=Encephalitozoon hellem TaxID=27973 RepID=A0A9Q9C506_ENCHE|nr:putative exportin 1 [Encephalitozoon hellem ATCC 50504]AFM99288.1 putative exportin 1 [Encephalitozoon hellem ATCC 50504]UTX44291.1 exportin 1 [Encephalitozoon hellem]WEL39790.1 exportin 1 [Encephalitozoon hellem]|eukprot:XP_003888269.1 putative exportin 1 [Encephalitozoon hellem ATCC 50504]